MENTIEIVAVNNSTKDIIKGSYTANQIYEILRDGYTITKNPNE